MPAKDRLDSCPDVANTELFKLSMGESTRFSEPGAMEGSSDSPTVLHLR